MSDISVFAKGLGKNFRSFKKSPGLSGSIKSLFSRSYQDFCAVSDFEVEIKRGELIGLLGPNGAGKTTLMKMFTGIIVPSHGELKVLDRRPWDREKSFRKKIALVMGQKSQLWWDIPALDSFLLLQKYYEIPNSDFVERLDFMSNILQVKDKLEIHVRKLSLGERMKLELMACLLHDPDIIFLDEPTIGLDLIAQENIRKFLLDYHARHKCTMMITSHYMADVQALCERLILIFNGKKCFDGAVSQFEKFLGNDKELSFTFASPQDPTHKLWNEHDARWKNNYTQVDLRLPEAQLRDFTIHALSTFPITEFSTEKMPIERVMKELMHNPKLLTRV